MPQLKETCLGKDLFQLIFLYHHLLLKGREGRNSAHIPESRNQGRSLGRVQLIGLFLMTCSVCFLHKSRLCPQQWHCNRKECCHRLAYSPVLWQYFSIEISSSQMTSLPCVYLNSKHTYTHWYDFFHCFVLSVLLVCFVTKVRMRNGLGNWWQLITSGSSDCDTSTSNNY